MPLSNRKRFFYHQKDSPRHKAQQEAQGESPKSNDGSSNAFPKIGERSHITSC